MRFRRRLHVLAPERHGIRRGGVEEPLPFLCCQGAAVEHARQHTDVHVDRAVRNARVVTRALELRNRGRRDRLERHVAEVLLDEAQPFFLELDRPR